MIQRGGVELDQERCRALLASVGTGRIGLSTALGPHVVPVGCTVVDDAVVLWTSPYSIVARCAPGTLVAFEVDQVDPDGRGGWCVQARGRAEHLEDPDALEKLAPALTMHPEPWSGPRRRRYLRIRWTELSGQAVGKGWRETPATSAGHAAG